jgi:UDP-glucose 4-epimerase
VKWGPLEEGDIADRARVRAVLENYRPAALMHFAAYAYVGESIEQPLLYYNNNFAGTAALLQAVLGFRTMPVVFSSSCASYGVPEQIPNPRIIRSGRSIHMGHSKLFVERMLADLNVARLAMDGSPVF